VNRTLTRAGRPQQASRPRHGTLLVAPAVLAVLFVLGAGLGSALLQSVGLMPLAGRPELTLAGYLGGQELFTATRLSLLIAGASTLLAAVVGLTTALVLASTRRGRTLLVTLATASIPVPHLVGAASIGLLLADGGLVSRWLGVPAAAWPSFVAGPWPAAVIVEYAWKESAFVALVVSATMGARLRDYQETAALLGAGPRARLRHVSLPLAAPALLAASTITFVYTLGSYEVAWLLGAAYPEPLPVMSYRLFTSTDLAARPEAMAVAVTTAGLAGAATVAALMLLRRLAAWR
jgi:putative spermidine/putrescine transport system permease protein